MNVHIFNRDSGGSLTHSVQPGYDLGGDLGGNGDTMCWYIGTTRSGKIIDVDASQVISANYEDGAYWA